MRPLTKNVGSRGDIAFIHHFNVFLQSYLMQIDLTKRILLSLPFVRTRAIRNNKYCMNQKLKFHPVEMKPIDYLSEMNIMRVKKKKVDRGSTFPIKLAAF